MQDTNNWASAASPVCRHIEFQSARCLEAYRANPLLITEHANIERAVAQGGYGHRQLYELIQNGADALIRKRGGKIQVLLTERGLILCKRRRAAVDIDGANALLGSHLSMKHGLEISRVRFSVSSPFSELRKSPRFYSRSGSFCFDLRSLRPQGSREVIHLRKKDSLFSRIARPIDPLLQAAEEPHSRGIDEVGYHRRETAVQFS